MKFSQLSRFTAVAFIGLVAAFLAAPMIVVVVFAFDSSARLALPYGGVSLRWFRSAFGNSMITQALWQSIKVGLSVGVMSIILGYAGARIMIGRSRIKRLMVVLSSAPSMFPSLLMALGFAIALHDLNLPQGTIATIIGQTIVALPFATVVVLGRLRALDPSLADASRDLGASEWTTLRRVTLPLLRGALIAAGCFAMAISFDEFIIAFYSSGSSPTMPVVLWGLLRSTIDPTSNAVATVILVLCSVPVFVAVVGLGRDVERM